MTSVKTGVAVAIPDLAAIKQRQQATWASGDFGIIGTTLQIVGETLCEAADVRSGSRGAGRRRGQRQLLAGGGTPLVRRDVDRLRAGSARGRRGAAPTAERLNGRPSARPTSRRCRSSTAPSTS